MNDQEPREGVKISAAVLGWSVTAAAAVIGWIMTETVAGMRELGREVDETRGKIIRLEGRVDEILEAARRETIEINRRLERLEK